jgi:hypothetical protein
MLRLPFSPINELSPHAHPTDFETNEAFFEEEKKLYVLNNRLCEEP